MKKFTFAKSFLVAIALILCNVSSWANSYSYTFSAKVWSAYDTQTLSGVSWTAAATGGAFWSYDTSGNDRGQQFGTTGSAATALSLSTTGIGGVITSVKINTAGASGISGSVSVSVGSTAFKVGTASSVTLSNVATSYDFTGASSGTILISWTQTSNRALYIKSIDVTYAVSPPVVTAASPTGTVGTAFSYNISATNSPTSYAITSGTLPAGLSLNTTSGLISGTPTTIGSATVNVTATNAAGTSTAAALNFSIGKGSQTITFNALDTKTLADSTFKLTAKASSGLPVSYTSSNTAVATVADSTVTILSMGTTTITASQSGNTNYNAATNVGQLLTVGVAGTPTIAITDVTAPEFTTTTGSWANQTMQISGEDLTNNIGITISGTNANQFSLSQASISPTNSIVLNTVLTVKYTPTSAGTHTATLTLASTGAPSIIKTLTGTAQPLTADDSGVRGNKLNIVAIDGCIQFTTQNNETVEIYNAIGQKLVQKIANRGINSIPVSARGVLFVKVGNSVAKIIL